uniref:Chemosensory protein n=1 Tax=Plutella xylostella TaxID=51655 RepID=B6VB98_PLUXY|nr:ejaculatory bulb-specific protein 3-like precursor [Plutella xylostella]ACJ04672.1 chemosensory protein [Plutella xylostella]
MQKLTLACLLVAVAAAAARPNDSHYTDRYDNVNLDELISNRRLLVPYVKCVLDQGKCSPDGKELKEHIQEALENNCGKCTDKQREGTRKMIGHPINHEQEFWDQLIAKYDPERKYVSKYEKELKEVKASCCWLV